MMSIFGLRIKEDRMKKAIKKTCVVLLLFALLVSQVAASYSETGTLNEGTSAISAAERYLSSLPWVASFAKHDCFCIHDVICFFLPLE